MENAKGCLAFVIFAVCLMFVFLGLMGILMPGLQGSGAFIVAGVIGVVGLIATRKFLFDPVDDAKGATQSAGASVAVETKTDYSSVPSDWEHALANAGLGYTALRDLEEKVDLAYKTRPPVYPARRNLFRALHLTSPDEVKVVILGQDPYPTPGDADGLAFSVAKGRTAIPQTLSRILDNLYSDLYRGESRPSGGDLTPWAEEGVLLLNTALTFQPHESREDGYRRFRLWEPFTMAMIRAVSALPDPVVFILWGDDAQAYERLISSRHWVITSAHPSPRNQGRATVATPFDDSRPFSEANRYLGPARAIDWRL